MKLQVTDLNAPFRVVLGYRSPFFSGSLWHGLLGHALLTAEGRDAGADLFARFMGARGPGAVIPGLVEQNRLAQQASAPPPRMIPLMTGVGGTTVSSGDRVDLALRFFGPLSHEDLAALQRAIRRIADLPLGRDAGRLESLGCDIVQTVQLDTNDPAPDSQPSVPERLQMTLLTPLCIKQRRDDRYAPPRDKKVLITYLDFATLFVALHRRLTLLCSQFGEFTAEDNARFRPLAMQAQSVQLVQNQLRYPTWQRESERSRTTYRMRGLLGSLVYEGPVAPFVPYLRFAEATHIGSDTSFGLGRVRFERLGPLGTAPQPTAH